MRTIEFRDATGSLADYAAGIGEEPIVVTRAGRPIAVLMPISPEEADSSREAAVLANDPTFLSIIERSRARAACEGSLTPDAVRRTLGLN